MRHVNWFRGAVEVFRFFDIRAKLVNASPGIVFATIGVILCCVILNRNAVES